MSTTRQQPSDKQPESLDVVIVDDEALARQLLRELLADHPHVRVVAECANGFEAVKAVTELSPDVLLLDVQMPKLDGFEVVELLADDAPSVIFATAHDHYALRAFEIHAIDYLLKPISAERLAEALERVKPTVLSPTVLSSAVSPAAESSEDGAKTALPMAELAASARPPSAHLDRILVRDGSMIHVVACHRLDYIEAQDDYVMLVMGDVRHRKAERLTRLADALDPGRFVRIHRSYLLNIERLARLELYAKDSRVAILRDGSRLPVSRSGYARLRELL